MDISVLIVDDDKLVVDKLVEGVNWTQLGIGTVLTCLLYTSYCKY